LLAAGWCRALDEARRGEAKGKGRPEEERRLAAGELRGSVHQLLEVLFAQHVGEMLDLTCGRIDVIGDWPFILLAHLATRVVQGCRYRIQGAGHALLLQADLRRRLLASRVDELHGLVLRLADDLRTLATHASATTGTNAAAAGALRTAS
jgi:hypothetical protein